MSDAPNPQTSARRFLCWVERNFHFLTASDGLAQQRQFLLSEHAELGMWPDLGDTHGRTAFWASVAMGGRHSASLNAGEALFQRIDAGRCVPHAPPFTPAVEGLQNV